jgi:hypothetical protein
VTHRVGLVRYAGQVHGWVLDLPGCIAGAPTLESLDQPLRLGIAEYAGWLRSHGEPAHEGVGWEIAEDLDGEGFGATGGEFCFDDDRRPVAGDELKSALRLLEHSRAGLVGATEHLAPDVLDWSPPREAFAHFDAWAPEVRTIRDVARHVLELEVYYRAGLRDGAAAGIFEPVAAPWDEHAKTVDLLRGMSEVDLSRSYWPVRPGRSEPEEWTVCKALRRLISHERVHTAEIWQRRSWVLLGTPR